jgi:hypothetical protein
MSDKPDYVDALMELMLLEERRSIEPEKFEFIAAGATRQRVKNATTVSDTVLDIEDRRVETITARPKKGFRPLTAEEKSKVSSTFDRCQTIMENALTAPKRTR